MPIKTEPAPFGSGKTMKARKGLNVRPTKKKPEPEEKKAPAKRSRSTSRGAGTGRKAASPKKDQKVTADRDLAIMAAVGTGQMLPHVTELWVETVDSLMQREDAYIFNEPVSRELYPCVAFLFYTLAVTLEPKPASRLTRYARPSYPCRCHVQGVLRGHQEPNGPRHRAAKAAGV